MPRSSRPVSVSPRRAAAALLIAAGAALAFTACAPEAPSPSSGPSSDPSAGPSATAEPSTDPTAPAETATPYTVDCTSLITPEQLYAFNPNVGTAPDYSPVAAEIAAVVEDGGTACGWTNQTSGELIEVGVAKPTPTMLEERKSRAALGSQAVPTYGTPPAVEGFFEKSGEVGEAQVFTESGVWLVISSTALFEPGDAQQLVEAALGNLPA